MFFEQERQFLEFINNDPELDMEFKNKLCHHIRASNIIRKHELEYHNPEWPKRWLNFDKNVKRLHKYKG